MNLKFRNLSVLALVAALGLSTGYALKTMSNNKQNHFMSFASELKSLGDQVVSPVYAVGTPTAIGTLRNNIFLIIGYPSASVYEALDGGGPQSGLVGLLGEVLDGMTSIATANGVSTCAAIPATGTATGTITVNSTATSATITYETPTHTAPTGWTNAGETYGKRIKAVVGTMQAVVEFTCDKSIGWALLQVAGDTEGITGETRALNFYIDFQTDTAKKLEMAMKVYDDNSECGGSNDCEVWLMRAQTGASDQFSIWQASYAWRTDKFQGERLQLNGNHSNHEMSSFYTFESNFGTTLASVTGTAEGATDTDGTTAATEFNFDSTTTIDLLKQGCIDYDSPDTALSAATVCTGYAFSDPATTVFQSSDSADFSYTGLKDLVDNIETL